MWSDSDLRPADADWPTTATPSFIGRRGEAVEIKELVLRERLVTLTGVAGVGKTRLGAHVAAQLRGQFPDGVHVVEVGSLREHSLLAHTIAMAVAAPSRSPRGALADLVDFLRDKKLLIVIDNCEHLVETCAEVVSTLLAAAADLRVLTTSRQALGIIGEHVWRVPPLAIPEPNEPGPSPGDNPALALFAARAMAVQPGFRLTEANRETVTQICRQLDGIPLAIELAAVRLQRISLDRLLVELTDRFGFLGAESTVSFARHRTLRAAMDWSYDLCSPAEQLMWRRMSVFPESFDMDTAEQVCVDGIGVDEVCDLVGDLLDKSILLREERFGIAHYRMLDTIREYGEEKLRAHHEETPLRRRHRDRSLRLVEQGAADWFGPNQVRLLSHLRAEHPNIRAALDFSLSLPDESRTGLIMASALWSYWIGRGFFPEGRYWLDRALRVNPETGPERSKALWVDGWIAALQGDSSAAVRMAEKCRSDARQLQDSTATAHGTHVLGVTALLADNMVEATTLLSEAIRRLSEVLTEQPDNSDARSAHAIAGVQLAAALSFRGHPDKAIALCHDHRRLCEEHGERWVLSYALYVLALAEWESGRLTDAASHARECLDMKRDFADVLGIVLTVDLLAWIAAAEEECERATMLLGAADRMWPSVGQTLFGSRVWSAPHRMCEAHCRHELGDHAYESAHRRGAELSTPRLVAYAAS